MGVLSDLLQNPATRRPVLDTAVRVVEEEVNAKTGLTGMGIKTAFKLVQGVKPGFIPMAMDHLMDDFARQVDPFYDAWVREGAGSDLKAYFIRRDRDIANALLEITDGRARRAENKVVKQAYDRLRPLAEEHTRAAVPRIAELVQAHAPRH